MDVVFLKMVIAVLLNESTLPADLAGSFLRIGSTVQKLRIDLVWHELPKKLIIVIFDYKIDEAPVFWCV